MVLDYHCYLVPFLEEFVHLSARAADSSASTHLGRVQATPPRACTRRMNPGVRDNSTTQPALVATGSVLRLEKSRAAGTSFGADMLRWFCLSVSYNVSIYLFTNYLYIFKSFHIEIILYKDEALQSPWSTFNQNASWMTGANCPCRFQPWPGSPRLIVEECFNCKWPGGPWWAQVVSGGNHKIRWS